jgi:hypothetical protein
MVMGGSLIFLPVLTVRILDCTCTGTSTYSKKGDTSYRVPFLQHPTASGSTSPTYR